MTKAIYTNDELREEYRGHFGGRCEVWQHLPEEAKAKCKRLKYNKCRKIDIHHIFHNIGRIDEWSNIIAINHKTHLGWGHGFHSRELTIVCLYAKWWKSQQEPSRTNPYPNDEFNLEEMRYCFGRCVLNWLEWQMNYELDQQSPYWAYCLEIRESF